MNKKSVLAAAVCAALLLPGCGSILDRSYDAVQPHTHQYWEDGRASVLRAEDHQSLVNGLMVLVSEQADQGLVRLYGYENKAAAIEEMDLACAEVTKADALGAYLVSYMTYDCAEGVNCYEVSVTLTYRRSGEQLRALVNASSADAVPDLLREALKSGKTELAVKLGHCDCTEEALRTAVEAVMLETGRRADAWEMQCYPADVALDKLQIVEIRWSHARG